MRNLPNILTVARREYLVRVRTRSFRLGTVVLLVAIAAVALVPVILRVAEGSGTTTVQVWVKPGTLPANPAPQLQALLDAASGAGAGTGSGTGSGGTTPTPAPGATAAPARPASTPTYSVTAVTDLDAARAAAAAGRVDLVVAMERSANGSLACTLYAKDVTTRSSGILSQTCTALAISDRLSRAGLKPDEAAAIFAPADFSVEYADPSRKGGPKGGTQFGADYLSSFGMTILVFMLILLYGNWVAASVVDEKSSRVMEVILNAATPFQLLAGKILGVGAVALTQYVLLVLVGTGALLAQGPIAARLLGSGSGDVALPSGITPESLVVLAVLGILGFLLYACLYAASGSLVSRQEDLQQAVMPMTLISTVGYMVAVYSATGLIDLHGGAGAILAQVPLFSPFLMLARFNAGQATILELLLAIAILVVTIVAALWLAARVYAVGVLLYGQRPGWRAVWRLLREGM